MWLALRAILGRIGGYILAGLGVLAYLRWRDGRAKAEVRDDIERDTLRKRAEMASVARPDDAEVTKAMREGRF